MPSSSPTAGAFLRLSSRPASRHTPPPPLHVPQPSRKQQVAFVKRGEAAAQGVPEGHPVPGFSPAEASPVAADFSQKWQSMIESVNRWAGGAWAPCAQWGIVECTLCALGCASTCVADWPCPPANFVRPFLVAVSRHMPVHFSPLLNHRPRVHCLAVPRAGRWEKTLAAAPLDARCCKQHSLRYHIVGGS